MKTTIFGVLLDVTSNQDTILRRPIEVFRLMHQEIPVFSGVYDIVVID